MPNAPPHNHRVLLRCRAPRPRSQIPLFVKTAEEHTEGSIGAETFRGTEGRSTDLLCNAIRVNNRAATGNFDEKTRD